MSEPFLGQIQAFGFNFTPRGWAACSGQLLPISQNQALFSLLGTTYGGDGQTTFALPDLRGRAPLHFGTGGGLTPRTLGEQGGTESVTLTTTQIPSHAHDGGSMQASANPANTGDPTGHALGLAPVYSTDPPSVALAAGTVGATQNAGGSQPHANMQPYLVLNWCIALQGIFPSPN